MKYKYKQYKFVNSLLYKFLVWYHYKKFQQMPNTWDHFFFPVLKKKNHTSPIPIGTCIGVTGLIKQN